MRKITSEQFINILQALGVRSGDGLMVHSALHLLGWPVGGVEMYFDALCNVLNIETNSHATNDITKQTSSLIGTLVVPTFTHGFPKGEPFDPLNTPSEMGALSEYLRKRPEAMRTLHPVHSVAVIGMNTEDFVSRDTSSAFESGSVFERMIELDFKLLLLGVNFQAATIVHYSEQNLEVPYRRWKEFTAPVRIGGKWKKKTYRIYVREMKIGAKLNILPVQKILEDRDQIVSESVNSGLVSLCKFQDFVNATDELLKSDPWALVENRPENKQ